MSNWRPIFLFHFNLTNWVFTMFYISIWDASLPKRNHTFLRHEKSCSLSASSFSTLKSVHKIGYFLNKWNCRDMTWIVIFVTFIWYLWTKMNWLWIMLKTFIWIISRNMLFIQKYPQFSQKMSTSNACMLATFFISDFSFCTSLMTSYVSASPLSPNMQS